MTQTATKERPILFSGSLIPQILDGRKTQTRRVIKPRMFFDTGPVFVRSHYADHGKWVAREMEGEWFAYLEKYNYRLGTIRCPYGVPGDRLWARETFGIVGYVDGYSEPGNAPFVHELEDDSGDLRSLVYRSEVPDFHWDMESGGRWKPSIHMPRWASRITLEVKRVWVERVQEISEADAIAEGMIFTAREPVVAGKIGPADGSALMKPYTSQPPQWSWHENATAEQSLHNARMAFANLWNSINASKGHGWDTNPWVWCVEFERVEGEA